MEGILTIVTKLDVIQFFSHKQQEKLEEAFRGGPTREGENTENPF